MKRLFLLAAAVLCLTAASVAQAATKKDSGTAWVGVTHSEGSDLYVGGDIKDKILGRGAIVYVTALTSGPEPSTVVISAKKITVYTPKGTLVGTGKATQTNNPDGTATLSDGTFNLTKGTGKLKGHKLKGTFTGTFTDGVYTLSYSGTYK
jgi:hypothetical protein